MRRKPLNLMSEPMISICIERGGGDALQSVSRPEAAQLFEDFNTAMAELPATSDPLPFAIGVIILVPGELLSYQNIQTGDFKFRFKKRECTLYVKFGGPGELKVTTILANLVLLIDRVKRDPDFSNSKGTLDSWRSMILETSRRRGANPCP